MFLKGVILFSCQEFLSRTVVIIISKHLFRTTVYFGLLPIYAEWTFLQLFGLIHFNIRSVWLAFIVAMFYRNSCSKYKQCRS